MFCQTGFYARLGISPVKFSPDLNPEINFESNAGTKIWIKPDGVSSNIGLSLHFIGSFGYQSNKIFTELGIRGDGVLTSYKCGYVYYDKVSNTYVSTYAGVKTSDPQRVYFAKFGLKIQERDSSKIFKKLKHSLFIYASIETRRSLSSGIGSSEIYYTPDGVNTVHIIGSNYSNPSNSFCTSFGLMFLINTVKNKNICNVNVYYVLKSKKALVTTVFQIRDIDNTNYIAGGFDSYGSGLVLELSKNLYWSNFYKRKRN